MTEAALQLLKSLITAFIPQNSIWASLRCQVSQWYCSRCIVWNKTAIIASQSKACCLIVGMGNISTACSLFDLVLHVHFPPHGLDIHFAALRTALCRFAVRPCFLSLWSTCLMWSQCSCQVLLCITRSSI